MMVLAEGSDQKFISEEMRTVTVNAQGAMILLGLKVVVSMGRRNAQLEPTLH